MDVPWCYVNVVQCVNKEINHLTISTNNTFVYPKRRRIGEIPTCRASQFLGKVYFHVKYQVTRDFRIPNWWFIFTAYNLKGFSLVVYIFLESALPQCMSVLIIYLLGFRYITQPRHQIFISVVSDIIFFIFSNVPDGFLTPWKPTNKALDHFFIRWQHHTQRLLSDWIPLSRWVGPSQSIILTLVN